MQPRSDLAVEASGLVKTFGETLAVDGADLAERKGTVLGPLVRYLVPYRVRNAIYTVTSQPLCYRRQRSIRHFSYRRVIGETLINTSFDTSPAQQTATVGNAGSAKTA